MLNRNAVSNTLNKMIKEKKFIIELTKQEIKKRYSGTLGGNIWAILKPLATIFVFWLAFELGIRVGRDTNEYSYFIWFALGYLPWFVISECITRGCKSVERNKSIVKKMVFPLEVLPKIEIMASFYPHICIMILFVIYCEISGIPLTLSLVQLIYYMAAAYIFLISLANITSAFNVYVKDTFEFIRSMLTALFWFTPIVWQIEILPPVVMNIVKLNPFYYIIQGYRDSVLHGTLFWEKPYETIIFWSIVLIINIVGKYIFKKLKVGFADVI